MRDRQRVGAGRDTSHLERKLGSGCAQDGIAGRDFGSIGRNVANLLEHGDSLDLNPRVGAGPDRIGVGEKIGGRLAKTPQGWPGLVKRSPEVTLLEKYSDVRGRVQPSGEQADMLCGVGPPVSAAGVVPEGLGRTTAANQRQEACCQNARRTKARGPFHSFHVAA